MVKGGGSPSEGDVGVLPGIVHSKDSSQSDKESNSRSFSGNRAPNSTPAELKNTKPLQTNASAESHLSPSESPSKKSGILPPYNTPDSYIAPLIVSGNAVPLHPAPSGLLSSPLAAASIGMSSRSREEKVKKNRKTPKSPVPDAADIGNIASLKLSPHSPIDKKCDGIIIGADDREIDLKILIRALVKCLSFMDRQIEIKCAKNAAEIKKIVEHYMAKGIPCEAIFTDNDMDTNGEGIAIGEWVKNKGLRTPVALITGNNSSETIEKAREAKIKSILIKGEASTANAVLAELIDMRLITKSPFGFIDLTKPSSPAKILGADDKVLRQPIEFANPFSLPTAAARPADSKFSRAPEPLPALTLFETPTASPAFAPSEAPAASPALAPSQVSVNSTPLVNPSYPGPCCVIL